MATEVKKGRSIEVSGIAADWDYGAVYTSGKTPKINSITFIPGGASDVLVVKDGSDTGPIIFRAACAALTDDEIRYFNGAKKRPYIDFSDCTLTAGHKVLIDLWKN